MSLFFTTNSSSFHFRVIVWALRAKQAETPSEELDRSLTIYWQMTFAIGYISMYADTVTLLRCLFVQTTKGAPLSDQTPLGNGRESPDSSLGHQQTLSGYTFPVSDDEPRRRFWYRRTFGALALLSWVPVILGVVMGYNYVQAETSVAKGQNVQSLRFASKH